MKNLRVPVCMRGQQIKTQTRILSWILFARSFFFPFFFQRDRGRDSVCRLWTVDSVVRYVHEMWQPSAIKKNEEKKTAKYIEKRRWFALENYMRMCVVRVVVSLA